jgi:polyvinyl alcohol dehydrogenase (cytochrome)
MEFWPNFAAHRLILCAVGLPENPEFRSSAAYGLLKLWAQRFPSVEVREKRETRKIPIASYDLSLSWRSGGLDCMARGNENDPSSTYLRRLLRAKYRGPVFMCFLFAAGLLFSQVLPLCAQQAAQPPLIGPQARMAAQVVFNKNCASCHQNVKASADETAAKSNSAPNTETLGQMTPEAIYAALATGPMVQQAAGLTNDEKRIVAEFFGGRPLGSAEAGDAKHMTNHCSANPPMGDPSASSSWNGWGNDLGNTRFQPARNARLSSNQVPHLKLKWAFGFPGGAETYGQPAIVDRRVFLGDDNSFVYSLAADTGCVFWSFHADAQVRTAIVIGRVRGRGDARYAAYFGDKKANIYAVDARTGDLLWKVNVERRLLAHITGATVLYRGLLYVGVAGSEEIVSGDPHYPCCTYRGSLSALDAQTGKTIWKTYTIPEEPKPTKKNSLGTQLWAPAGASIWTAPTIDTKRHAVYVGTGNAFTEPAAKNSDAIVAYDLKTGKLLWSYQALANDASPAGCGENGPKGEQCPENVGPDWDFANSPILQTLPNGKRILVAAHKGGGVVAVDPDRKGALLWSADLSEGKGGNAIQIMWGGAADAQNVYYPLKSGGVVALRLSGGTRVWLTPLEPLAISAAPGGRPRRGQDAAATAIPGVVFSGGWDGVLYALSTADGRSLWEYDTAREYVTVNGVSGKGGSLGAPGPVVVGGMLYVGSGYVGTGNGMSGNVLLAFAAQ